MQHHDTRHLRLITELVRVVQHAGNDLAGALTSALRLLCEELSASAGLAWEIDRAGRWRLLATHGASELVDAALRQHPTPTCTGGCKTAEIEDSQDGHIDIHVLTPRGEPVAALRLVEVDGVPDGPVLSALVEAIAGVMGHTCALLGEHLRFEQAQQATGIGNWQWRVNIDEVWLSEQMCRNLGVDPGVLTLEGYLARVHPEDRDVLATQVEASLAQGGAHRWVHRVITDEGATRWIETSGQVVCDDDGVAVCVTGVGQDITHRRDLEQEVVARAERDDLTGLANRRGFQQALERRLEHQAGDDRVVVAQVAVDGLRAFNEQFGWASGDRMLQEVADRLRRVEHASMVARLSAAEFALLFTEPPEDLEAWVERLGENIAVQVRRPTPLMTDDGQPIEIAVGLAVSDFEEAHVSDALLRSASVALQVAKARTNARWQVFDPDKHQQAMQRLAMESDLRRAVEQGEIELAYQPIIALDSGEVTSVEALARWHRSDHGPVSPATFIPIAERVGLMPQLGAQVLDRACRQLHAWEQVHPRARALRLTVNLSALQLDDPHLVDTVQDVLARHQLAADRLVLEVTETTVSRDVPGALARLFELRRRGVRIAIDDFGTGYSSLARLREIPFDILKIDRSFVKDIVSRAEPTPILQALFAISRSLDLEVVAEGVETPVQLAVMLGHDCGYVQGFLFSPPLGPTEFESLLSDQTAWDPGTIAGQVPAPKTWSRLEQLLNQLADPDPATGHDVPLDDILDALAELTGLDSVYLTRISLRESAQEIVAARNLGPIQVEAGRRMPWADTLCRRALATGDPVIADVQHDHPDATDAQELGIGTYVGVEVHGPTGELRGTLCGVTAAVTGISPDTIGTFRWAARLLADPLQREQALTP